MAVGSWAVIVMRPSRSYHLDPARKVPLGGRSVISAVLKALEYLSGGVSHDSLDTHPSIPSITLEIHPSQRGEESLPYLLPVSSGKIAVILQCLTRRRCLKAPVGIQVSVDIKCQNQGLAGIED